MRKVKKWFNVCRKIGHIYLYDGDTLGGIWIRCALCKHLEEYLPGVHEPEGGEVVWYEKLAEGKRFYNEGPLSELPRTGSTY